MCARGTSAHQPRPEEKRQTLGRGRAAQRDGDCRRLGEGGKQGRSQRATEERPKAAADTYYSRDGTDDLECRPDHLTRLAPWRPSSALCRHGYCEPHTYLDAAWLLGGTRGLALARGREDDVRLCLQHVICPDAMRGCISRLQDAARPAVVAAARGLAFWITSLPPMFPHTFGTMPKGQDPESKTQPLAVPVL